MDTRYQNVSAFIIKEVSGEGSWEDGSEID